MMTTIAQLSPAAAIAALSLVLLTPASVAGRDATIRLPEELAERSSRHEFSGFGGFNNGRFDGAGYRGEFSRRESRLGVFDPLYAANRGKGSFVLRDASDTELLSADCVARQDVATIRVVTFDLRKLNYECAFARTGERLTLGGPRRQGFREKLLAKERRSGEAIVFDQHLVIESIHRYAGTRLESQAPLGYSIALDGVIVAAVDLLDWNPIVHLSESLSQTQQHSVVAAALSLAVLRDPAVSALEDLADLD